MSGMMLGEDGAGRPPVGSKRDREEAIGLARPEVPKRRTPGMVELVEPLPAIGGLGGRVCTMEMGYGPLGGFCGRSGPDCGFHC